MRQYMDDAMKMFCESTNDSYRMVNIAGWKIAMDKRADSPIKYYKWGPSSEDFKVGEFVGKRLYNDGDYQGLYFFDKNKNFKGKIWHDKGPDELWFVTPKGKDISIDRLSDVAKFLK